MFVRSKVVKGRTYYQLVETSRDKETGRVRQRVLASLGTQPTIEGAFRAAEERYFVAPRRGGRRGAEAAEKAWERLASLAAWLEREQEKRGARYHWPERFAGEWRRRHGRKGKDRVRREKLFAEFLARHKAELRSERIASSYATFGLAPPVTPDQVKAAFRRKARECHPDHGGSTAAMAEVNGAYRTLREVLGFA